MTKDARKMDEAGLGAFLDGELRKTIGFGMSGDEISAERTRNLAYYLNRPLGDEEEGRSKLQDSSVQDVVEALLPDLLAPFISSDRVVEFKPVGKEDEEHAELASDYANHIFASDNDGVHIQYVWVKDALLQKNGFVYADWTQLERTRRSQIKVYFDGLQELINDPEVEIIQYAGFDAQGNGIPPALLDSGDYEVEGACFEVDLRRTYKEGRVKVRNIPPEFVVVSNTATSAEDARIIGWQERVTLSDLREEGYDEAKISDLSSSDGSQFDAGERSVREQAQGGQLQLADDDCSDKSSRKMWRTIVWARVDYDGDGKAELRKIVRAGANLTGGKILLNEEADEVPVVSFTPIPMPHQLFGRCPADQTISIQDGKTALLRATMDGTYHTIEPRMMLVEPLASVETYDDLMLNVPGAPVRVQNAEALRPLHDAPDLSAAYQMLEYFDRVREVRTPVTRQDQGVDPDVLQNKTAREATIQANASARRKELILRLYAEALGKLFKLIHKTVIKHQDRPREIRLMGDYIKVDPRFWNADMDVSVSVGLGTGTKDQQLQGLMVIRQHQMELMQMGAATGIQLVTPDNLYNTEARIVEYSGLSSPELYFTDPQAQEEGGMQPQPDPQAQAQQDAQQQQEAEQIRMAVEQAREEGRKEGQDQVKIMEIESKERMHAKDSELSAADLAIKAQQAMMPKSGENA